MEARRVVGFHKETDFGPRGRCHTRERKDGWSLERRQRRVSEELVLPPPPDGAATPDRTLKRPRGEGLGGRVQLTACGWLSPQGVAPTADIPMVRPAPGRQAVACAQQLGTCLLCGQQLEVPEGLDPHSVASEHLRESLGCRRYVPAADSRETRAGVQVRAPEEISSPTSAFPVVFLCS
eukprot:SAG11_NODE_9805_length_879_cov_1.474359_1_plen_179_part_00